MGHGLYLLYGQVSLFVIIAHGVRGSNVPRIIDKVVCKTRCLNTPSQFFLYCTELLTIVTLARFKYELLDRGRRPKHVKTYVHEVKG